MTVSFNNQPPFVIQLSSKSGFSKSSFLPLRDGTKLFAKDYEIIHLNGSSVVQRGFLPQKIEALFESSDEKIWVALNKGGIVCYLTEDLSLETSSRYLSAKTITSITEDQEGNTWFGSEKEGIYLLPGKPEISYSEPKILITETSEKITPLASKDSAMTTESFIADSFPLSPFVPQEENLFPTVFISHMEVNDQDVEIQDLYRLNAR